LDKQNELKNVCGQPFIYLGKGSQAYAFQSQDGRYVLKLFKYYHLKPIPWLENLSLFTFLESYRHEHLERRKKKLNHTLKSYQIAHDIIPEECGLLFLQIAPSSRYHQLVSLTDKVGRNHTIDLANHGYAIQKRATLVFPTLERWISERKLDDAKVFLRSLVTLIVQRSLKGVQDQDPDLHKNAGVIDGKAIFIDVGSFHVNEQAKRSEVHSNDVQKITRKLRVWLQNRSPELNTYLESELATLDRQRNS
jgi:hypothetical protein